MEVSGQLHAPGKRTSGNHWIGGWVVPSFGLNYLHLPGFEIRSLKFVTLRIEKILA